MKNEPVLSDFLYINVIKKLLHKNGTESGIMHDMCDKGCVKR